jgi:hypothetical protein
MNRKLKTTIVIFSIVTGLAVTLTAVTGTAAAAGYVFQFAGLFALSIVLLWPDISPRLSGRQSSRSADSASRHGAKHRHGRARA